MQRFFFALHMLWQYRKSLYRYLTQLSLQTEKLFQVSLIQLQNAGIKVLILDFDGVLAGYGMESLNARHEAWLQEALTLFGTKAVFILSNRPSPLRQRYFADRFPDIQFVKAPRKKPFPDGILAILRQSGVAPEQVLIIDDRLLTGILAAILSGIKALWVTRPEINFYHKPTSECGFIILRWLDKLGIRLLHWL